jgi:hypothetical protein
VLGKTTARHTSAEFVAFLTDIVIDQPRGKEIHVIADNQSAHKSRPVTDFLAVHPKVHLHFTPTYSSGQEQEHRRSLSCCPISHQQRGPVAD